MHVKDTNLNTFRKPYQEREVDSDIKKMQVKVLVLMPSVLKYQEITPCREISGSLRFNDAPIYDDEARND